MSEEIQSLVQAYIDKIVKAGTELYNMLMANRYDIVAGAGAVLFVVLLMYVIDDDSSY